jgi:hypothetical protein
MVKLFFKSTKVKEITHMHKGIAYLWMWLLLLLSVPDTQRIERKADQVENLKRYNILMSDDRNMQVFQRYAICLK